MRIAIVGSRDFPNLKDVEDFVLALPPGSEVVSGGARGVDSVAYETASKAGLAAKVFQAEWDRLGPSAGFLRNLHIVDYADRVVAFWDGKSKGTKHSIEYAIRKGKPVEVHYAR